MNKISKISSVSKFEIEEITEESFSTIDISMDKPAFEKEEYMDILGKFKNIFEEDCQINKNTNNKFTDFLAEDEDEIDHNFLKKKSFGIKKAIKLAINPENFKASTKIFKIKSKNNNRIYQNFKVEIFEEEDLSNNLTTTTANTTKPEEMSIDTSNFEIFLKKNFLGKPILEPILEEQDKEENLNLRNPSTEDAERECPQTLPQKKRQLQVNNFRPVPSSHNISGNYQNYLAQTMQSLSPLLEQDYTNLINERKVNLSKTTNDYHKKTLILDLDETLIHSDFDEKYENHDKEITFHIDDEEFKVKILLRPQVKEFLKKVNELFEVIVFTAGLKEYADAALDYLDPENVIFKHRLYRDSCICVNNAIHIKDLNIFANRKLEELFIVDNSFYSFCNQPENGILINSFFNEKDNELVNVFGYLENCLLNAGDVREANEKVFGFKGMVEKSRRNFAFERY